MIKHIMGDSNSLMFKNIQHVCNLLKKDQRMSILEVCHHLQSTDYGRMSV